MATIPQLQALPCAPQSLGPVNQLVTAMIQTLLAAQHAVPSALPASATFGYIPEAEAKQPASESFEFVVIGAATAATAVGSRLSKQTNGQVLVLQVKEEPVKEKYSKKNDKRPVRASVPKHNNLHIIRNAHIEKIAFDDKGQRVVSVTYTQKDKQAVTVNVKQELVLLSGKNGTVSIQQLAAMNNNELRKDYNIKNANATKTKDSQDRSNKQFNFADVKAVQEVSKLLCTVLLNQKNTETSKLIVDKQRRIVFNIALTPITRVLRKPNVLNINVLLLNPNLIINMQIPNSAQNYPTLPIQTNNFQSSLQRAENDNRNSFFTNRLLKEAKRKKEFENNSNALLANQAFLTQLALNDCERFKLKIDLYQLCFAKYITKPNLPAVGNVGIATASAALNPWRTRLFTNDVLRRESERYAPSNWNAILSQSILRDCQKLKSMPELCRLCFINHSTRLNLPPALNLAAGMAYIWSTAPANTIPTQHAVSNCEQLKFNADLYRLCCMKNLVQSQATLSSIGNLEAGAVGAWLNPWKSGENTWLTSDLLRMADLSRKN